MCDKRFFLPQSEDAGRTAEAWEPFAEALPRISVPWGEDEGKQPCGLELLPCEPSQ